jgi:TRAP transporter 4TM/12TM fusion protein
VNKTAKITDSELQDLVVESDSGARRPSGITAKILLVTALSWSLFQLWTASPLPYTDLANFLNIPVLNSTYIRYIHLAFALTLAYISYPAFKSSPRGYVPVFDRCLVFLSLICVLYLYFYKDILALRAGLPTIEDIIISIIGIGLVMEAARRALGPPLFIICVVFLFYTFAGGMSFIPEIIAHKGQSLSKVASHQWLSTEGVFGIAIGVSADFVFLFVLFGSLLEKAGAGNYFIQLSFSLLGHLRGGPAKAAVLASGMTGVISGSSIANVVTTGTFTIPLMRRVGFSREKAGAVEVAASVDGQIMPPVMGAAAFLMTEYVGLPYVEVAKAAFIPAIISYIALLYIVHLEAVKEGMIAIKKTRQTSVVNKFLSYAINISGFFILAGFVYYGIGFIKQICGVYSIPVICFLMVVSYIGLVKYASFYPPLEIDDPNSKLIKLPETGPTLKTGLHYILPIIVLLWCLIVERQSPGLSAFWATLFLMIILLTQNPLMAYFRGKKSLKNEFIYGFLNLLDGLISGAKNMTGIAIATAAAGIIVGVVSLTGVGQVLTDLVEKMSGGSFVLVLVLTALISLILGMGLPTTANYVVVANLMAPVIAELAGQSGIIVPLIAIHLFVFYFGIMADITPPVGLASFAAAAISGGDPIKTGLQAFMYSIRTAILPFIFIYNTDVLLIGVNSIWHGISVFIITVTAMLLFVSATQGYLIVKNRIYETIILLLVTFALFRPEFWVNKITPEFESKNIYKIENLLQELNPGQEMKIGVLGTNSYGDSRKYWVYINSEEKDFRNLAKYGLVIRKDDGQVFVDDVVFDSKAEKAGFDFNDEIVSLELSKKQMSKNWIYLVAVCGLLGVITSQIFRRSEIVSVVK